MTTLARDDGRNIHTHWRLDSGNRLGRITITPSAGCLVLELDDLVLEVTPDDAARLAWRLLCLAEEMNRPLGHVDSPTPAG